jgi:L-methionine (R)-S-oxide reductase
MVPEVDLYPGHITCDVNTKSEIVCPLILLHGEEKIVVGVMDLDCLAIAGFDEEDQTGLQNIAKLIVEACDW